MGRPPINCNNDNTPHLFRSQRSDRPYLGLATTRELLDEIRCRIAVDYHAGGGGLDYTTVRGRPEGSLT